MENEITLRGLLSVIESSKPITINLFNGDLLLITFVMNGYACLEDEIEQAPVTKIIIKGLNTLDITINKNNE